MSSMKRPSIGVWAAGWASAGCGRWAGRAGTWLMRSEILATNLTGLTRSRANTSAMVISTVSTMAPVLPRVMYKG